MAILDLSVDKWIEGYKPRGGKRTFGSAGTVPAGLMGGGRGGFGAAKINGLTMDFLSRSTSADQDLQGDNKLLRARARTLALDSPFARKFLAQVVQNVVGPAGILMQAKVTGVNGKTTAETKRINQRIEDEWRRWCKVGRCTADGRYSFVELQQMVMKNIAREGENLVKMVYGREFNDVGFALQPLDNDQLDDSMMLGSADGSEIRMGVEVNQYRRPLGYWLYNGHPNDAVTRDRSRTRVPAAQIIHSAVWERPAQTRGYTWMTAAILPLNQFNRYDEAVVVAARAAAAKFLMIKQTAAEGYTGDEDDEDENGSGNSASELINGSTGEIPILEEGQDPVFFDPRFPTNNHREYTRTCIRNIATGLLVSYPTLGNDLESVNFSSIRAGLLDERDSWRIIQAWFIDHFLQPVFEAWLKFAQLTVLSDITLSPAQRDQIEWKPRGWEWVDPLKDAQATVLKLQNGLITYASALASLGLDFEETMVERAREQAFIEELGVTLGTDITGVADTADDSEGSNDKKNE